VPLEIDEMKMRIWSLPFTICVLLAWGCNFRGTPLQQVSERIRPEMDRQAITNLFSEFRLISEADGQWGTRANAFEITVLREEERTHVMLFMPSGTTSRGLYEACWVWFGPSGHVVAFYYQLAT
jgi:hypothetical protein